MFYVTYAMKDNEYDLLKSINNVRAWLIVEVSWFFAFIWASAFSLMISFCFRKKQLDDHIFLDDDIWSSKSTDDFLR